jgi:hypothetical protein
MRLDIILERVLIGYVFMGIVIESETYHVYKDGSLNYISNSLQLIRDN